MKRFWLVISNLVFRHGNRNDANFFPAFFLRLKEISFILFIIGILIAAAHTAQSQQVSPAVETEYKKMIDQRVAKIINTLEIKDSTKYRAVHAKVADQYFNLNTIHDESKAVVAELKKQSASEEVIKKEQEKKYSQLKQLHDRFIAQLKKDLTEQQIDQVKDGMTYRVFPVTYTAYLDKIPALTTEQKDKIYAWLKDARELAMDEGSSEDKHAVFGKFKGRINNYLSAQGYDLKKEEKDWQARLKERREKEKQK